MQNGTIRKLVIERGFGFIAAEDGEEYFFHRSGTDVEAMAGVGIDVPKEKPKLLRDHAVQQACIVMG